MSAAQPERAALAKVFDVGVDWMRRAKQAEAENTGLRQSNAALLAACKRVLDVITGDQAAELGIYAAIALAEKEIA